MIYLWLHFSGSVLFVMGLFLGLHFVSRAIPHPLFPSHTRSIETYLRFGLGFLIVTYCLFVFFSVGIGKASNIKLFSWMIFGMGVCEALIQWYQNRYRLSSLSFIKVISGGIVFLYLCIWVVLPAAEIDEIIYHLEIPRQMLQSGSWYLGKDNIYGFFPQAVELLFSLTLSLNNIVASKLIHTGFGVLMLMTLYVYLKKYLSSFWAIAACLLFISVPTVSVMMSWAYVDLAFTWCVLMSWICVENYFESADKKWIFFVGLFCAMACCTKYTGIQWTLILTIFILFRGVLGRVASQALFLVVGMGMVTGLIFLPVLIRNYYLTGWPLYPFEFLNFPLHSDFNWEPRRSELFLGWIKTFGAPIGAHPFVIYGLALIRVFIDGEFNNPERFDGIIGPVFLLIPIFYFMGKTKGFPKTIVLVSGLYLYYWLVTTRQARFIVPALPFLCFMVIYGLSKIPRNLAVALLSSMLLLNGFYTLDFWVHKKPWKYMAGHEKRDDYLARQHQVFSMYQAANKFVPAEGKVYLLNMKNYGFYLDVPWRADFIFERYNLEKMLYEGATDEELEHYFKDKGVTHLLMDWNALSSQHFGLEPELLLKLQSYVNESTKLIARKDNIVLLEFLKS